MMIVLGTMAATGANLGPLDTTASTKPLLVTMLILLAASATLCWQTMLGGLAGLINMRRGNTADTMPAMAAVAPSCNVSCFWQSRNGITPQPSA